ncbi:hypothetical protein BDV93DRAFT_572614, partial [Ceratobasidium sp. AG-I]
GLSELIQEARRTGANSISNGRVRLTCHSSGVDMYNTLRVIYASVVSGAPEFDADTLTSALRVATTYGYPELREFAMSNLEKVALAPIDRIRLSDEFSLPSWEKLAFTELCKRAEPVSMSEAQVLGIERLTHIARIREAEQRRQFVDKFVKPVMDQCCPKGVASEKDNANRKLKSSKAKFWQVSDTSSVYTLPLLPQNLMQIAFHCLSPSAIVNAPRLTDTTMD